MFENKKDKLTESDTFTKCIDKCVTDKRKIFRASKQNKIEEKSEDIGISGPERLKQLQERDITSIRSNLDSIACHITSIQLRVDNLDRMCRNIREVKISRLSTFQIFQQV